MKMRRYRIFIFSILIAMFLMVGGCAAENSSEILAFSDTEPIELWIVTEQSVSDGMNAEAQRIAAQFEDEHSNVTVKLDILPSEEDARSKALAVLKDSAAEGRRPDIYLLPTDSTLTLDEPKPHPYQKVTPLFPVPEISMREGAFLDIAALYDADNALGKEGLREDIIDAGTLGDCRYILPLRFTMPVVYYFPNALTTEGMDSDTLEEGIGQWLETVNASGSQALAKGSQYTKLNAFSQLVDYDAGEVTLTSDEMADYLRLLQKTFSLAADSGQGGMDIVSYLQGNWSPYAVNIGEITDSFLYELVAAKTGKDVAAVPLRSTDGDVIANVVYYGAIDASCSQPKAAYALLRCFLSEESQWEYNRQPSSEDVEQGPIEQSWPVRAAGAKASLWQKYQEQMGSRYTFEQALSNEDFTILGVKADIVRFRSGTDNTLGGIPWMLIDSRNANAPTDVDIDALSERMVLSLQQWLTEVLRKPNWDSN